MNMNDFEAFDIGAWTVEGLTKHVKSAVQWAVRKKAAWPGQTFLASSILMCIGSTMVEAGPQLATATRPPLFSQQSVIHSPSLAQIAQRDIVVGSPVQFWTNLSTAMRSWKQLDEAGIPEMPPFI